MKMTIRQIVEAAGATVLAAPRSVDEEITSVTWDSRTVDSGSLYLALVGERVDGHDYVANAVNAGARAVIASRRLDEDQMSALHAAEAALLLVEDVVAAYARIAGAWRKMLAGRVVGVSGSTGKTTTKNLVRDVLAAAGSVIATEANQNNELGVPRTLLAAQEDTDSVVVEMGMRGLGQIEELCAFARPDWGLVTNAGESHIELLGSRENIARAKSELFEALPAGEGIAFINAADDYAVEFVRFGKLNERKVKTVFFEGGDAWRHVEELGVFDEENPRPFVWASNIELDAEGCPTFVIHAANFDMIDRPEANGELSCSLSLRGVHNVSNSCSAAAVGLAAGLSLDECCRVLASAQPERGRQQIARARCGALVVDDSYNANPDSMRASISTFAGLEVSGKRIAVLGDMLELGDFSQECHERIGTCVAESGIDRLVCVGDLSVSMANQACRSGMDQAAVTCCADAAAALAEIEALLAPEDAVLVKASHSIGLQAVVEGLVD